MLILPSLAWCQLRENAPLPAISKKPLSSISKGLTGWCKSTDGQWIENDNLIALRTNSKTPDYIDKKERSVGTDNIEALELYGILYGSDTLMMIVKRSHAGAYMFSETKERWKSQDVAWFFIFNKEHLEKLKQISTEVTITMIPLMAEGQILDPSNLTESIESKLNLNKPGNHQLVLTSRSATFKLEGEEADQKKIQFQMYSFHPNSGEIGGVFREFEVNGKSVMEDKKLLDYCYYEIDEALWMEFLNPGFTGVKY